MMQEGSPDFPANVLLSQWRQSLIDHEVALTISPRLLPALVELLAPFLQGSNQHGELPLARLRSALEDVVSGSDQVSLPAFLEAMGLLEDEVRGRLREQSIRPGSWDLLRDLFRRLPVLAAEVWVAGAQTAQERVLSQVRGQLAELRLHFQQQDALLGHQIAELRWLEQAQHGLSSELETDLSLQQALAKVSAAQGLFAEPDVTLAVVVVDDGPRDLRILAAHGVGQEEVLGRRLHLDEALAGDLAPLLDGMHPLVFEDTAGTGSLLARRLQPLFLPLQPRFLAAVPLAGRHQRLGFLTLTRPAPASFTSQEEGTLLAFSGLIALAMENASLYLAERRRHEAADASLSLADDVSTSLNVNQVLQRIADKVRSLIDADVATILLLEADTAAVVARAIAGGDEPREEPLVVLSELAAISAMRQSLRPLKTANCEDGDPKQALLAEGSRLMEIDGELQALVVVPVIRQDSLFGLLAAGRRRQEEFTTEQGLLLELFAVHASVDVQKARLYESQRLQAREAQAVNEITRTLLRHADLDTTYQRVVQETSELLPASVAYLAEVNEAGSLVIRASRSEQGTLLNNMTIQVGDAQTGPPSPELQTRNERGTRERDDSEPTGTDTVARMLGLHAVLSAPLRVDGRVSGILAVGRKEALPFSKEDGERLFKLADQAALAIAWTKNLERLRRLNQDLRDLASRDSLTGLFNHGHFIEQVTQALSLAQRYNYPLSLLMLDVDHFKQINDTYGHPAGDSVLKWLAAILDHSIRGSDTLARLPGHGAVGRLGGDEFSVLLPHTDARGAEATAERIHLAVNASPVALGEGAEARVSVSIGTVTQKGNRNFTAAQLVREADVALYAAKRRAGSA
ncbi:MAG: diguanylate cyclase [Dehalococcoidia bacterium]